VSECLEELTKVDNEWKKLWDELQLLLKTCQSSVTPTENDSSSSDSGSGQNDEMHAPGHSDKNHVNVSHHDQSTSTLSQHTGEHLSNTEMESSNDQEDKKHEPKDDKKDETNHDNPDHIAVDKINQVKSRLYVLSSEQQKIIAKIANLTAQTIVPLRDSLQNLTKQLYYVKTDMSEDKTVCEVSGNFMSFRDAEERIAAHYAGKQYVGWKMVRDKFKELDQKAKNWMPVGGGGGAPVGPPVGVGRYGGGGGGSNRGGYGPPQPTRGGYGYPPPPPTGQGRSRQGDRGYRGHYDRNDRSRSRDRDNHRWERDRGPLPRGGGGGEYNRRGDRRGWR
jgi:hypothetical protein